MDDLAGEKAEKAGGAAVQRNVKFRSGTGSQLPQPGRGGEFRKGEFHRPRGAIGEDNAVPANIATVVAFRDEVIRGWIPRQEPEAQLTVFVGGNRGGDDCAGGQIRRSRIAGRC